ncbi:MAG TPA: DUF222 domain-containing protein [Actinomycetes bacterium]
MDDIGNAADIAHSTDQQPGPLGDLSLPQLEDRLGHVAAHIAASECEFLDLLAEFDAREGWGESGMRSTAHWLSWRVGLRLGVAREKVRVARALRRLPLVHEAFAAGSLSYCKVRALSRVATPTTEADLVEIARSATGAQLETVVKGWRRILVGEMSASAHIRRGVRRRIDDDGSHVYTIRVAPEAGPVFDNALDMARRVVLDNDGHVVETPEEKKLAEHLTEDPPIVRADADALLLIMESFLADGPQGEAGDRHLVIVHTDVDALAEPAAARSHRTFPRKRRRTHPLVVLSRNSSSAFPRKRRRVHRRTRFPEGHLCTRSRGFVARPPAPLRTDTRSPPAR